MKKRSICAVIFICVVDSNCRFFSNFNINIFTSKEQNQKSSIKKHIYINSRGLDHFYFITLFNRVTRIILKEFRV